MKCAQHVDLDAVGTCTGCGRGLCPTCISAFASPFCSACALAHNKRIATSLWIQLALMGGLFIATMFILAGRMALYAAVGYSLMAAFFPSGWNFLGRYFAPSGGYLFPVARWLNLLLQAAVASIAGVVVGPIYLVKAWKEIRTARATEQTMAGQ